MLVRPKTPGTGQTPKSGKKNHHRTRSYAGTGTPFAEDSSNSSSPWTGSAAPSYLPRHSTGTVVLKNPPNTRLKNPPNTRKNILKIQKAINSIKDKIQPLRASYDSEQQEAKNQSSPKPVHQSGLLALRKLDIQSSQKAADALLGCLDNIVPLNTAEHTKLLKLFDINPTSSPSAISDIIRSETNLPAFWRARKDNNNIALWTAEIIKCKQAAHTLMSHQTKLVEKANASEDTLYYTIEDIDLILKCIEDAITNFNAEHELRSRAKSQKTTQAIDTEDSPRYFKQADDHFIQFSNEILAWAEDVKAQIPRPKLKDTEDMLMALAQTLAFHKVQKDPVDFTTLETLLSEGVKKLNLSEIESSLMMRHQNNMRQTELYLIDFIKKSFNGNLESIKKKIAIIKTFLKNSDRAAIENYSDVSEIMAELETTFNDDMIQEKTSHAILQKIQQESYQHWKENLIQICEKIEAQTTVEAFHTEIQTLFTSTEDLQRELGTKIEESVMELSQTMRNRAISLLQVLPELAHPDRSVVATPQQSDGEDDYSVGIKEEKEEEIKKENQSLVSTRNLSVSLTPFRLSLPSGRRKSSILSMEALSKLSGIKIDPNYPDSLGNRLIHYVIIRPNDTDEQAAIIKKLLDLLFQPNIDADPFLQNRKGKNAFDLNKKILLEWKNDSNQTLLHLIISKGRGEKLLQILPYDPDMDCIDVNNKRAGRTRDKRKNTLAHLFLQQILLQEDPTKRNFLFQKLYSLTKTSLPQIEDEKNTTEKVKKTFFDVFIRRTNVDKISALQLAIQNCHAEKNKLEKAMKLHHQVSIVFKEVVDYLYKALLSANPANHAVLIDQLKLIQAEMANLAKGENPDNIKRKLLASSRIKATTKSFSLFKKPDTLVKQLERIQWSGLVVADVTVSKEAKDDFTTLLANENYDGMSSWAETITDGNSPELECLMTPDENQETPIERLVNQTILYKQKRARYIASIESVFNAMTAIEAYLITTRDSCRKSSKHYTNLDNKLRAISEAKDKIFNGEGIFQTLEALKNHDDINKKRRWYDFWHRKTETFNRIQQTIHDLTPMTAKLDLIVFNISDRKNLLPTNNQYRQIFSKKIDAINQAKEKMKNGEKMLDVLSHLKNSTEIRRGEKWHDVLSNETTKAIQTLIDDLNRPSITIRRPS